MKLFQNLIQIKFFSQLILIELMSSKRDTFINSTSNSADAPRFSYLTMFIHVVIGQFHLLEGDDLLQQLVTGEGGIGMNVKSRGCRRVRFASLQPATTMIGVSIPLIVDRHNVHQHCVTTFRLESAEAYPARWKHSSAKKCVMDILLIYMYNRDKQYIHD